MNDMIREDDLPELDFGNLEFPGEDSEEPAAPPRPLGMSGSVDPNGIDLFFVQGGYSTTVLPPDMMGIEAKRLWSRIRLNALLGRRPETQYEWLIRTVMGEVRKARGGCNVKAVAVFAAVGLAVAKTHGIPIKTWERHVAKDVRTKYATLVKIRRLAVQLIDSRGIRFALPEWLKYEWS